MAGDADAREPQIIKSLAESIQSPSSQFSERWVTLFIDPFSPHGEWDHWSASSKQEKKLGHFLLLDRVMESLEISADDASSANKHSKGPSHPHYFMQPFSP